MKYKKEEIEKTSENQIEIADRNTREQKPWRYRANKRQNKNSKFSYISYQPKCKWT